MKKMEPTAAIIVINSLIKQIIGQNGKYPNILQISVWVVLLVHPTFAMSFVLCTICTCNASAPCKFACTARAVCAKKTQKNYKSKVYMKHNPKYSLKNIMVFSTLARNMKANSSIVELCSTLN